MSTATAKRERGRPCWLRSAASDWAAVRRAWAVPEALTPSSWAAEYRVLREGDSAEPGPWSNERTPYLTAIMDACAHPTILDVAVMKAARVGLSEALRNVLGYWIDQDPGPVLEVLPTESDARELADEKILPMLRGSEQLRRHLTGSPRDLGKGGCRLRNMRIHFGWAGSAASLGARLERRVIFDECDKYPMFSGREADPIALGEKRAQTFGVRRFVAKLSTPTTRQGYIWQAYESAPVKLRFHVPCPKCGAFQVLAFAQLRWSKHEPGEDRRLHALRVRDGDLAWYECGHCGVRLAERDKAPMLRAGCWAEEGTDLTGEIIGASGGPGCIVWPDGRPTSRVGFHLSGLYSPWRPWSDVAADFIQAEGHPARMMDFRNATLGEPYEEEAVTIRGDDLAPKVAAGHPALTVPTWAGILLATADMQKDHLWFVIRAWGRGFRSRLIDCGRVGTFDELRERCLLKPYRSEVEGMPAIRATLLAVDAGGGAVAGEDETLTQRVYQFAETDPNHILPVHGFELQSGRRAVQPFYIKRQKYAPPMGRPFEVSFGMIHSRTFKDILSSRIKLPADDPAAWELHRDVDRGYSLQMSSEHKILVRRGQSSYFAWEPISAGAPNHLWDCEVYQCALAELFQVDGLPSVEELVAQRRVQKRAKESHEGGIRTPDGRPWYIMDR